jgi:hypothetical protein
MPTALAHSSYRKCFQDVSPALNSSIHHNVEPIAHGIDDFRKLIERRARSV